MSLKSAKDQYLQAMSFGDHLEELRRRLLYAILPALPLFIVGFIFGGELLKVLILPAQRALQSNGLNITLQVLTPPEIIMTELKLSAIASLVATAPWLLYQAWLFIAPGLYQRERRFVYFLIPGSAILTVCGVALLYFVMLPLMLHVLINFGTRINLAPSLDEVTAQVLEDVAGQEIPNFPVAPEEPEVGAVWIIQPEGNMYAAVPNGADKVRVVHIPAGFSGRITQSYRVSWVVNFTLVLLAGIVIAFQMPLVIVLLGWMDLASAEWLRKQRKYALLVCAGVSAMITPADVASMLMMLVPLYGLYELGIILLILAPAKKVAEGDVFKLTPMKPAKSPGAVARDDAEKDEDE